MLLSRQIAELAQDFRAEARQRPYFRAIIPTLVEDESFWRLMLEVLEIIVHRRGYVIVSRTAFDNDASKTTYGTVTPIRPRAEV